MPWLMLMPPTRLVARCLGSPSSLLPSPPATATPPRPCSRRRPRARGAAPAAAAGLGSGGRAGRCDPATWTSGWIGCRSAPSGSGAGRAVAATAVRAAEEPILVCPPPPPPPPHPSGCLQRRGRGRLSVRGGHANADSFVTQEVIFNCMHLL